MDVSKWEKKADVTHSVPSSLPGEERWAGEIAELLQIKFDVSNPCKSCGDNGSA